MRAPRHSPPPTHNDKHSQHVVGTLDFCLREVLDVGDVIIWAIGIAGGGVVTEGVVATCCCQM